MTASQISLKTRELATLLGVSQQTVSKLTRAGVLHRNSHNSYGIVAVRDYCTHLREQAAGRGDAGLATERMRLAKAQADAKELDNQERIGALVPAEEIEATWLGIIKAARARLLAVPARVRSQRSQLNADDMLVIDAEVRVALEELADGADR